MDDFLSKEMQQNYLRRKLAELESVDASSPNLESTQIIGHQIKGNAKPFGFDELMPLGASLEEASKEGDIVRVVKLVNELRSLCLRLSDRLGLSPRHSP